jgi:S-layer protein
MTGGITFTTAGTVAETVKGGASANVLTATTGTTADTLIGGAGSDTLTANAGLDVLTGGLGRDNFVVATVTANVNVYSTITDFLSGDTLTLANKGTETFARTKLTLGSTAVFQDYANLAAAGDGSANGLVSWFQFGGDTYVVEDTTAGATFTSATDVIVKLTGLVDLSTAGFSAAAGTAPSLIGA